jgi:hypothetical protein
LAVVLGIAFAVWFLKGGPGRLLRGEASSPGATHLTVETLIASLSAAFHSVWSWTLVAGIAPTQVFVVVAPALAGCVAAVRWRARRGRRYVRLVLEGHRTDQASAEAVVKMFDVVQFLDSPGGGRATGRSGDDIDGGEDHEEGELLGVGAKEEEAAAF